jgi:type VI secretion system secreted protein VgrG
VIVDFLEGDPDRPIITGRVYNAEQMPAGPLPQQKNVTGFKSNSTKGGGGYNEFTLDDTKGKEKIKIHGQSDMNTTVEHDETLTVHNDRAISVGGKHMETVKKDTTIRITEGKYSHDVMANTATYHVQGKVWENYDNDLETTVKGNIFHRSTDGTIREEAQTGEFYLFAKEGVEVKSATDKIHILAATEIKLQVGASSLLMKADGTIQLSGTDITISGKARTAIGVGNQNVVCDKARVAVSGAAIASSAVGKHEITGALVKIN